MVRAYASGTEVAPERSRDEIERTLTRYGADGFAYGWQGEEAMVAFQLGERHVRFRLPMPERGEFARAPAGRARSPGSQQAAYEAEVRRRWRALALMVKAKLEAVATGIVTFDEEFLAHMVVASGGTIGEALIPQLGTGTNPRLELPSGRQ